MRVRFPHLLFYSFLNLYSLKRQLVMALSFYLYIDVDDQYTITCPILTMFDYYLTFWWGKCISYNYSNHGWSCTWRFSIWCTAIWCKNDWDVSEICLSLSIIYFFKENLVYLIGYDHNNILIRLMNSLEQTWCWGRRILHIIWWGLW